MFQDKYLEWHELTPRQQAQAETMFNATRLIGRNFADYVYMLGNSGDVLCRRAKTGRAYAR